MATASRTSGSAAGLSGKGFSSTKPPFRCCLQRLSTNARHSPVSRSRIWCAARSATCAHRTGDRAGSLGGKYRHQSLHSPSASLPLSPAPELLPPPACDWALELAEFWNGNIERWTSVDGAALAKRLGVPGWYVRVLPVQILKRPEIIRQVMPIRNRSDHGGGPADEAIGTEFLQLVMAASGSRSRCPARPSCFGEGEAGVRQRTNRPATADLASNRLARR